MKLIIDIPEEEYKKLVNPYQHNEIWCNRLKRMVMNGISFDSIIEDIKAEIKNITYYWCEVNPKTVIDDVLEIIDKHIMIRELSSVQPINRKQEEINQALWAENETLEVEVEKYKKAIKALGEDMRKCQESITDEKVIIGFNMAVALCNKHLAEKENQDTVPFDFELYESGLMNMPKGMIEVLDKIRAEIAEIHLIGYAIVDGKREIASRAVIQIIDKYKAESEDKE